MKLKKSGINAAAIAATYIGTVIGAGFASGQEILQFFTVFGTLGIIGILVNGILFTLLALAIFRISRDFGCDNYRDFIYRLSGHKIGLVYDILLSLFLLLGVSIMFSGSGAIFKENLGLPKITGVLFISVLTLFVAMQSLKGLMNINSLVVPIMSFVILLVLVKTFIVNQNPAIPCALPPITENPIKALFFALFYSAYNTLLSIGVLCAIPGKTDNTATLRRGAMLGGIGLMMLALALDLCLLLNRPDVFQYSIPMLYVIHPFPHFFQALVTLCIWCEIFTTAVSSLFSLAMRISAHHPQHYKIVSLALLILCLPLSMMDFKQLVAFLYPFFGALSLILMLQILFYCIKKPALRR